MVLNKRDLLFLSVPIFLSGISIVLLAVFSVQAAPTATTHTVCASGCDFSSIQVAINAAGPGDTLSLAGETFTEPFTLDKSLTIEGAGAQNTVLQAAAAPGIASSRVVTITDGVSTTITGVTIRYGKTLQNVHPDGAGGGILNQGTLTLTHSIVFSNTAENEGGGLYNGAGSMAYIADTTFSDNSTDGLGGGMTGRQDVILNVSNSTFLGNKGPNGGGGIYLLNTKGKDHGSILNIAGSTFTSNQIGAIRISGYCTTTITGSTFQSNTTTSGGSGISNSYFSHLTISDSTFEGNQAGSGGGVKNEQNSDAVITDVMFAGNTADLGAGIYNYNHGVMSISNVTFNSNSADINGGGLYNRYISTATIAGTTFYSNSAVSYGGGIYNYYGSRLDLTNSTINGNNAGSSGGGIHNFQVSRLNVFNVTIDKNSAGLNGGGISNEFYSVLNLSSSIVSGSPSGGDCFNETGDEFGTVFDLGYNIIEDGTCISDTTSFAADPKLGPLQDNGGDTETQALLEGSPAIDVILPGSCAVTEDQRGVDRPQGIACDIGAFELVSPYDIFLPLVINE